MSIPVVSRLIPLRHENPLRDDISSIHSPLHSDCKNWRKKFSKNDFPEKYLKIINRTSVLRITTKIYKIKLMSTTKYLF